MLNYDSIAIVGVSRNPGKPSHQLLKKSLEDGIKVFAVNPNTPHIPVELSNRQIIEHTSHKSLEGIPQRTDAVVLYIPRIEIVKDAELRSSLRSRRYGTIILPPIENQEHDNSQGRIEEAIVSTLEDGGYVLGRDLLFDACLLTGKGL